MADNTVTLVGNATRAPELRYTTGGRGVASFGLAVNRRFQQNGEWQEVVSFFDVVAWAQLGENAAASIEKGTRVVVVGRLEQRSWDTQEGEKRSKVEVVADEIGVSLRWATATAQRTTRSRPAEDDDRGAPQRGGSSGGRSAPSYDEEPFLAPSSIGDV